MNGRMYDPMVGRFLSADPVLQAPDNLQNYNRYSYCLNNPMKYTDPTGYQVYNYGTTWSSNLRFDVSGGGGSGASNSFGSAGYGLNGTGLDGIYYDWYSGTYRSTDNGSNVGWVYAEDIANNYGSRYTVTETAYSLDGGKTFTGNGNYSIVKVGNGMVATGRTFDLPRLRGSMTSEPEGIDWKGVTNATVGLIGGMAEMAIGGASTYFSAGTTTAISGPLMIDGGVRTIANAQRLWYYFNDRSKLADTFPTSIGALAGKGIDMAFGTSIYNVGFGQAIGGWGNDLTSFVITGGNAASLYKLQKSPSFGAGLNYGYSLFSYPYSMYYNRPSK